MVIGILVNTVVVKAIFYDNKNVDIKFSAHDVFLK